MLLCLPLIACLAVAGYWLSKGYNQITGDEPHYLVIADAIVRDLNFRVDKSYRYYEQSLQCS